MAPDEISPPSVEFLLTIDTDNPLLPLLTRNLETKVRGNFLPEHSVFV